MYLIFNQICFRAVTIIHYNKLFFDNVRKVENFKTIDSLREVIKRVLEYCEQALGLKAQESVENSLYNEVTTDLLDKDIYLDNFETDDFLLNFEKSKEYENVYYIKLDYKDEATRITNIKITNRNV